MRRVLLVAAYPAFIALVVAVVALANGGLGPSDSSLAVVIRNEAAVPFEVRLVGRSGEMASYEIPQASEATITPPAVIGSPHEVTFLDARCVATDMMGLGDGAAAIRWSALSMLVIQADGSTGFLLPTDLATWNLTRQPLPAADPRPVGSCEEQ